MRDITKEITRLAKEEPPIPEVEVLARFMRASRTVRAKVCKDTAANAAAMWRILEGDESLSEPEREEIARFRQAGRAVQEATYRSFAWMYKAMLEVIARNEEAQQSIGR